MKENDVAELAGLLNITAEQVNGAIENGTVSELINNFKGQTKIFANDDFDRFQENLKKQALSELDKNNVPQPIYEYIKGSVLEKLERELAKEHGVQAKPVKQLVEEIISTKTKTVPDDEVARLKARIVEIEQDYEGRLTQEKTAYERRFIDSEIDRIINDLPIDADGEKLNNQREIVRTMLSQKYQFALENGQMVALKDGKPMIDTKLDPVPLKDVVYGFAKDYVNLSPAKGGRGDSSSTSGSRTINFAEHCQKKGIPPNSIEFVQEKKLLESKGYKLE